MSNTPDKPQMVTRVCPPSEIHAKPRKFTTVSVSAACADCVEHYAREFWNALGFPMPEVPRTIEVHNTEPDLYRATPPGPARKPEPGTRTRNRRRENNER